MTKREWEDAFWSGYNAAMGVVYGFEGDPTSTICQELIRNGSAADQLRVARKEQDCYLPQIRKTVKSMRPPRPHKRGMSTR